MQNKVQRKHMKYISIASIAIIFLAGCASDTTPTVVVPPVVKKVDDNVVPPKPKKDIKLKEVEDTNYSSEYMYPKDTVKKDKVAKPSEVPLASDTGMNKEECIAMISQEKFDKYATIFGSETASIKRCNMIKAMNQ